MIGKKNKTLIELLSVSLCYEALGNYPRYWSYWELDTQEVLRMESVARTSKVVEIELNLTESELFAFSDSGISKDLLCDTKKLAPNLDLSAVLIKIETPNFMWKLNEPWQLLLFSGEREALEGLSTKLDWVKLLSDYGFTPVHYAAMSGNSEILNWICRQLGEHARVLLMKKAYYGETVLDIATASGSVELLRWLCKTLGDDAKVLLIQTKTSGQNVLHTATHSGSVEVVSWLCQYLGKNAKALLKRTDLMHRTVLHLAACSGKVEVLSWLCQYLGEDAKALLKQKDNDGLTVLNYAAAKNQASFDRLVLSYPEAAHTIIRPPIKEGGLLGIGSTLRPGFVLPEFRVALEALLQQSMQKLILRGYQEDLARLLFVFREECGDAIADKATQESLIKAIKSPHNRSSASANRNYEHLKVVQAIEPTFEQHKALLEKLEVPQAIIEYQVNSQSETESESEQSDEFTEVLSDLIVSWNAIKMNALKTPHTRDENISPSNVPSVIEIANLAKVQEKRLDELEQINAELKRNQVKLESSLNASQTETSSIQLDDEQKQAISEELATSKEKLEAQRKGELNFIEIISQLTTQITKLQVEKEQLKSSSQESAEKDKQITELENEIKRLESKLHSKKLKLKQLQKAHRELEREHVKLTQLYESHQAAFNEASTAREAFEKAEDNMRKRRDEYVKAVKRANELNDTLRTTSTILQASSLKAVQSNQQKSLGGSRMKEQKEVAWKHLLRDLLDKLIEVSNEGIAEKKRVIKYSGDDGLIAKKIKFLTRETDLPGAKAKDGKLYVYSPELSRTDALIPGTPILYKQSTSSIPTGSEFELSTTQESAEEVQRYLSTASTVQGGVSFSLFDIGLELGVSQEQVQSSAETVTASSTQALTIKPKLNLPAEGGDVKVNWYYVPKLRETTYQITVKGSVIVTFANKHKVEFDEKTGQFIVTDKKLGKLEKNQKVISIEQLMQKSALPEGFSEFVSDLHSQPGQVSYQRTTKVVEFYERRLEVASTESEQIYSSVAVDIQSFDGGVATTETREQQFLPPLNVSRVGTQVTEEVLSRMSVDQLITFIVNYRANNASSWEERADAMFKLAERYEAKLSGNLTPRREKLYRERARVAYEKAEQIIQGVRPNMDLTAWLSHRTENPDDKFGAASFSMTGVMFGSNGPTGNELDHKDKATRNNKQPNFHSGRQTKTLATHPCWIKLDALRLIKITLKSRKYNHQWRSSLWIICK